MQTKKSLAEYVKEHRVVIVVTAIAAAVGAIWEPSHSIATGSDERSIK